MMRRLAILSLSVVILFAMVSLAFGAVIVRTRNGKEIRLYKNSYALVIGNGNYTGGWDPLPGAIRDAKEMASALKKNGFSVYLKTDLKKPEFQEALASFVEERGRDQENRLLFCYAGHGHTKKISNDEVYLSGHEGNLILTEPLDSFPPMPSDKEFSYA